MARACTGPSTRLITDAAHSGHLSVDRRRASSACCSLPLAATMSSCRRPACWPRPWWSQATSWTTIGHSFSTAPQWVRVQGSLYLVHDLSEPAASRMMWLPSSASPIAERRNSDAERDVVSRAFDAVSHAVQTRNLGTRRCVARWQAQRRPSTSTPTTRLQKPASRMRGRATWFGWSRSSGCGRSCAPAPLRRPSSPVSIRIACWLDVLRVTMPQKQTWGHPVCDNILCGPGYQRRR
jgi:hypothetical protein